MPRRVLKGKVVSNKCEKTVVVEVYRRVMHPVYRKFITRSRKFMAHDPSEKFSVGDFVSIEECRPLSKRKCWKVLEV